MANKTITNLYADNPVTVLADDDLFELTQAAGPISGAIKAKDLIRPAPIALTFADPLVPDMSDGAFRTITMTAAAAFQPPTNATTGDRWEGWFTASGGSRVLTLDGAILIPSDSTFTGARTITSGKLCIIVLKYNGTAWMLNVVEGNY